MTARADRYAALMQEITAAIVLKTGTGEVIAQHYARAVMEFLQETRAANGTLYIPAPPAVRDTAVLRAALEAGESPRNVCRRFGVSRRTLARLFPGGLPRKKQKSKDAA